MGANISTTDRKIVNEICTSVVQNVVSRHSSSFNAKKTGDNEIEIKTKGKGVLKDGCTLSAHSTRDVYALADLMSKNKGSFNSQLTNELQSLVKALLEQANNGIPLGETNVNTDISDTENAVKTTVANGVESSNVVNLNDKDGTNNKITIHAEEGFECDGAKLSVGSSSKTIFKSIGKSIQEGMLNNIVLQKIDAEWHLTAKQTNTGLNISGTLFLLVAAFVLGKPMLRKLSNQNLDLASESQSGAVDVLLPSRNIRNGTRSHTAAAMAGLILLAAVVIFGTYFLWHPKKSILQKFYEAGLPSAGASHQTDDEPGTPMNPDIIAFGRFTCPGRWGHGLTPTPLADKSNTMTCDEFNYEVTENESIVNVHVTVGSTNGVVLEPEHVKVEWTHGGSKYINTEPTYESTGNKVKITWKVNKAGTGIVVEDFFTIIRILAFKPSRPVMTIDGTDAIISTPVDGKKLFDADILAEGDKHLGNCDIHNVKGIFVHSYKNQYKFVSVTKTTQKGEEVKDIVSHKNVELVPYSKDSTKIGLLYKMADNEKAHSNVAPYIKYQLDFEPYTQLNDKNSAFVLPKQSRVFSNNPRGWSFSLEAI